MLLLSLTSVYNDLLKANSLQRFVFFVILSNTVYCWSQQAIYTHYGINEGLPSSEVYDCFQDKEGYIWFATDRGISRYNGYELKILMLRMGYQVMSYSIFTYNPTVRYGLGHTTVKKYIILNNRLMDLRCTLITIN